MAIRIYNTQSRRKEDFVPVSQGKVGMYSCGPTVYDYFHIGNARAFVVPDVIRRYLQYRGYEVTLVQNITDIDDKIIRRAAERGVPTDDVVSQYTQAFIDDRNALGIKAPDIQPRATLHVAEMIEIISKLVQNGLAYERDGDVYYDVSEFAEYGRLSNQNIDDLVAGARVDVGEAKDDALDFTLWKAAKPGEPSWQSPWGPGRPGWHIECSAMSTKYLGLTFDIHTGGVDLVFPHHENEVAQSHGANGMPPVKYWVHNGFINIDGQRMGKSLGNFRTVRDILKQYPGKVVRYFLISNHYRKPINFSDEELRMCAKALGRLEDAVSNALFALGVGAGVGAGVGLAETQGSELPAWDELRRLAASGPCAKAAVQKLDAAAAAAKAQFEESMDDDFNTAGAIAALHELATAINTFVNQDMHGQGQAADAERSAVARAVLAMMELGDVVGIVEPESVTAKRTAGAQADEGALDGGDAGASADRLIQLLLDVRAEVRAAKLYQVSDMIRDRLGELGVVVEDTRDGARWKLV
ncbi:MAG TPA: cysteine--tRNA ligase, partial [Bacillota bacterium]|nr:cysteine--tRNA ligase [Bacillota bacterium]